MKAIKVMGTVNEHGQLSLDQPIDLNQNSRVEVIVLIPEVLDNELPYNELPSKEDVLADLRQAWHEAMTGQTIPVSQLWEGFEDE